MTGNKNGKTGYEGHLAFAAYADVIVTDGVSVSAAVYYEPGLEAPAVVAFGMGECCWKLVECAQRNDVNVFEEPSLAKELYNTVRAGETIHRSTYEAMSAILAYSYSIGREGKYFRRSGSGLSEWWT